MSSTTVTCLLGVLEEHPNMKTVLVREIELFMERPHISEKAVWVPSTWVVLKLFTDTFPDTMH